VQSLESRFLNPFARSISINDEFRSNTQAIPRIEELKDGSPGGAEADLEAENFERMLADNSSNVPPTRAENSSQLPTVNVDLHRRAPSSA
jgi:hypothetical protein